GEKNNGFDVLYHNMKHGQISTKELSDFIRERATIEEAYARSMTKLAKSASNFSQLGTFAPVWDVFKTSTEKLAICHLELVRKLQELIKEVQKYGEDQVKAHKKTKEEVATTLEAVQNIQSLSQALQKSKENYNNKSVDQERLRKEGATQREVDKAGVKTKKATESYKLYVEKYATAKSEFEQKMSETAQKFQDIEEAHIQNMKEMIHSYSRSIEETHLQIGEVHNEFVNNMENTTVENLIQKLAETKGTGKERPGPIEFEECNTAIVTEVLKRWGFGDWKCAFYFVIKLTPIQSKLGAKPRKRKAFAIPGRRKDKDTDSTESTEAESVNVPQVDEEGFCIKPEINENDILHHYSTFYSSSDSDDEDEPRRFHVEIKPVQPNNGNHQALSSIDELKATISNITLSPSTSVGCVGVDCVSVLCSRRVNSDLLSLDPLFGPPLDASSSAVSSSADRFYIVCGENTVFVDLFCVDVFIQSRQTFTLFCSSPHSSLWSWSLEIPSLLQPNVPISVATALFRGVALCCSSFSGSRSVLLPSLRVDFTLCCFPLSPLPPADVLLHKEGSSLPSSPSASPWSLVDEPFLGLQPLSCPKSPSPDCPLVHIPAEPSPNSLDILSSISWSPSQWISFSEELVPCRRLSASAEEPPRPPAPAHRSSPATPAFASSGKFFSDDPGDPFNMVARRARAKLLVERAKLLVEESAGHARVSPAPLDDALAPDLNPVDNGWSAQSWVFSYNNCRSARCSGSGMSVAGPWAVLGPQCRSCISPLSPCSCSFNSTTFASLSVSGSQGLDRVFTAAQGRPSGHPCERCTGTTVSRFQCPGPDPLHTVSVESRTSRGPSPVSLGSQDSLPIAVAFTESVNAYFKGADPSKCIVKITGDMTVSFPSGIIKIFTSNPSPAVLSFRLKNTSKLEQVLPNQQLLFSDPSQSDSNSKDFWLNMQALTAYLRKMSEQNPAVSYYNVDILKYQVSSSGIQSTPLNLAVYWKCSPSTTDVRVDYRYNPEALPSRASLSSIQVLVPVDGGVTSMQSLPAALWNAEQNKALWKMSDVSEKSENEGSGSLRAKFELSEGPSNPATLAVQFFSEGHTLSGVEMELVGTGYRLSLTKKRFTTGEPSSSN
ncbi:FCHO2 protein, partial [Amia calva]|nr:FCHO2 protein [Amia calva]